MLAAERLAHDGERAETLRARHAQYFGAWMAERAPLTRGRVDQLLEDVSGEYANIREAWRWAIQAQQPRLLGDIVRGWWVYFELSGRPVEGLALIGPALALPDRQPEARRALARVRRGLSMLHHRLGQHRQGLDVALAGIEYGQDCGDFEAWIGCVLNSGCCHWLLGAQDEAHAAYQRALKVARDRGDRHCIAWALGNLAISLNCQGRFDLALAALKEALAIDRELGNQYQVMVNLITLCVTLRDAGCLEEALSVGMEGLAHGQRHRLRAFTAHSQGAVGALLMQMDRLEQARGHLERALELARNTGNRQTQINVLSLLGRLALRDGRHADAPGCILEAAQLAQSCHMLPDLLRCLRGFAMVLESRGDRVAAARVYLMVMSRPEAWASDVKSWSTCLEQLGLEAGQHEAVRAHVPTLAEVMADLEAAAAARETLEKPPRA